jgi:arsenical pump membrane protein
VSNLSELPQTSLLISGLTVGLSLARPRLGPFTIDKVQAALLGVALTIFTGCVSPPEALGDIALLATPLATICCLMVITVLAEGAGVFHLLASRLAVSARGDGRRLFGLIFFTSAAVGAVFTNDAAVLIFTPLVHELLRSADEELSPAARLPYLFAVLYAANLVGALVVSNPVNMIIARLLGIGFLEYVVWMALPVVTSALVTYIGLRIAFDRVIPRRITLPRGVGMRERRETRTAAPMLVLIALVLVGFFAGEILGAPTWLAPTVGALAAIGLAAGRGALQPAPLLRAIPWSVLVFALSMFIVAHGLRNAGLTHQLGMVLGSLGDSSSPLLIQVVAVVTAVLSAILNNHPSVDAMGWTILDMGVTSHTERLVLGLATLIGGDLGPKMLPIGSLAVLIWLRSLAERGVRVSTWQYIKLGVPISLAAVILSALVLSLEVLLLRLVGAA